MSDIVDSVFALIVYLLPLAFSLGTVAGSFRLAWRYNANWIFIPVVFVGAISFPIFRFMLCVALTIRDAFYDFYSLGKNFSLNYEFLSRVALGESILYFLEIIYEEVLQIDKLPGIEFPLDKDFRIWWIDGMAIVLFFSLVGALIILSARLWKGNRTRKILAMILLMGSALLYLLVIGAWMVLERF